MKIGLVSTAASADAVYDCATQGPTFGGNHDFTTNLYTSASLRPGRTYACSGLTDTQCAVEMGGGATPQLVDLEVYVAR